MKDEERVLDLSQSGRDSMLAELGEDLKENMNSYRKEQEEENGESSDRAF